MVVAPGAMEENAANIDLNKTKNEHAFDLHWGKYKSIRNSILTTCARCSWCYGRKCSKDKFKWN